MLVHWRKVCIRFLEDIRLTAELFGECHLVLNYIVPYNEGYGIIHNGQQNVLSFYFHITESGYLFVFHYISDNIILTDTVLETFKGNYANYSEVNRMIGFMKTPLISFRKTLLQDRELSNTQTNTKTKKHGLFIIPIFSKFISKFTIKRPSA
jgi:hypothetical protein